MEKRNILVLKLEFKGGVYGNLWQLENLNTGEKKKLYTDYKLNNQYNQVTEFLKNVTGVKNIEVLTSCKDYYLILFEVDLLLNTFKTVNEIIKNHKF